MGLSFKDSLDKVKENNNARMMNNDISPMSLDSDDVPVYDDKWHISWENRYVPPFLLKNGRYDCFNM